MAYTYTPMYYSSFQDTITSLCMSILPFSSKNRRLKADQKLSKRHTNNLKWQQNSFHRILNLIGLHREGIVSEAEVSAFRTQLLEALIASPADQELPNVIRDKLLFLQDLLCAKCISEEEYHISKIPLLERLAAQGVEIDSRDVIIGAPPLLKNSQEEWSDIDLNDREPPKVVEKCKEKTPLKLLWRGRVKKVELSSKEKEEASLPQTPLPIAAAKSEKHKRKPFHALFQKEKQDEESECKSTAAHDSKQSEEKSSKKNWGFEDLKKWKRSSCEDESVKPYLPTGERSDDYSPSNPCTERIKKKLHSDGSSSDFFIDKVLGENIKKELSRIQSELSETNPNLNFSSFF
ncbi:hypothetical protein KSP40_PGU022199 [Platanthera guangdongensis]|uniref:Uncharacterized protein n=1 Tax=Platanthera guangdongensis TaxID=2320717 RepID=A0ABR2MNR5_9ASPA